MKVSIQFLTMTMALLSVRFYYAPAIHREIFSSSSKNYEAFTSEFLKVQNA